MADRNPAGAAVQLAAAQQGQFRIRPLRVEDLPALEWEGAYTHFRQVYAQAYQRARGGNARLWVLEQPGEEMLGQLFVLLNSQAVPELADGHSRAFIHSFRIRPSFRRRGLGSWLLRHAEGDLWRHGFAFTFLSVARANAQGRRFYARHGYKRMGADPGRWSYVDHHGRTRHVHEPGWRLRKELLGAY